MQRGRPRRLDVALLGQLAGERLEQRLADLDAAAGQVPAIDIAVLDQKHAALASSTMPRTPSVIARENRQ